MSPLHKTVAIVKSDGRYDAVVPELVRLAGAANIIRPGDFVLIKPNLHAAQHWTTSGTTNPALVAALIQWVKEKGATRVLVADSPFHGHPRPEETFTQTGMAEAVEQHAAEWTVLTRHPFRIFEDASPHLAHELGISELAFQADKLINVAVMKTHIDCMVTLGMKNLKGCIRNEDKTAYHNDLDIDAAIVALNQLLRPALTIVDGTLGMEGIGPASGRVVNFGHIFAGTHTPSVDAITAAAMGVGVDDARTLKLAQEEGMLDLEAIRVVGADLSRITRRFERPYEAMERELPGLKLQTDGACSACKLNVIRCLRDMAHAAKPMPDALVVIGNRPPREPNAVFVGRCTREHHAGQPYLPGCPPRIGKIMEFLKALRKQA